MENKQTIEKLDELIELQKEVVGLLTIRLQQDNMQSTMIQKMGRVGIRPKRIAALLNTTSNTVNVALSKSKKIKNGRK